MKVGDLVRHRSSNNICLVLDVKESQVFVLHCFSEVKFKGWYGTKYFTKV